MTAIPSRTQHSIGRDGIIKRVAQPKSRARVRSQSNRGPPAGWSPQTPALVLGTPGMAGRLHWDTPHTQWSCVAQHSPLRTTSPLLHLPGGRGAWSVRPCALGRFLQEGAWSRLRHLDQGQSQSLSSCREVPGRRRPEAAEEGQRLWKLGVGWRVGLGCFQRQCPGAWPWGWGDESNCVSSKFRC